MFIEVPFSEVDRVVAEQVERLDGKLDGLLKEMQN